MKNPLVSVLLPVYNSELYIYDALISITKQTYQNLEILIILNGTSDRSLLEINKIKDFRIKVINIKESIGLIKALNIGLSESKGKYIVRMDADDISYQNRIEKQIEYLEQNNDIGLCGTWYRTFGGSNIIGRNKVKDQDIKIRLLHQCHVCHPTVVLRKSILKKYNLEYSNNFPHTEDYALWIEMSDKTKFYTYPEILLKYRDHDNNISKVESIRQRELSIEVKKHYFHKLGCTVNNDEILLYTKFAYSDFTINIAEIQAIDKIIYNLIKNINTKVISSDKLKDYLGFKWNNLITNSKCNKRILFKIHSNSFVGGKINSFKRNLIINLKLCFKGILNKLKP